MVFAATLVGLLGVVFEVLGWLIWKKQKISLLHDYHYDRVSEGNKADFCRLSGLGVGIIGAGLLITAVLIGITDSAWSFVAFAAGFCAGIALLIYAGSKYNR